MEYYTQVKKLKYVPTCIDMGSHLRPTTEWKQQAAELEQYYKFLSICVWRSVCLNSEEEDKQTQPTPHTVPSEEERGLGQGAAKANQAWAVSC